MQNYWKFILQKLGVIRIARWMKYVAAAIETEYSKATNLEYACAVYWE